MIFLNESENKRMLIQIFNHISKQIIKMVYPNYFNIIFVKFKQQLSLIC